MRSYAIVKWKTCIAIINRKFFFSKVKGVEDRRILYDKWVDLWTAFMKWKQLDECHGKKQITGTWELIISDVSESSKSSPSFHFIELVQWYRPFLMHVKFVDIDVSLREKQKRNAEVYTSKTNLSRQSWPFLSWDRRGCCLSPSRLNFSCSCCCGHFCCVCCKEVCNSVCPSSVVPVTKRQG